ncbi:hypothetical protein BDZ94DRAFT_1315797 [Collybia nuda]|uniref:Uncharacterized protein n=1 Tax=Collybia nuda TaxID=64659 RepID=A0A9P5XS16_9AGAR|nr:hypothetical protein BDZ94DRAFT_1315797 [Collybia nuda]
MPRNKRQRPDIDVYYATPESDVGSQAPPNVVHRHTAFETNTSGVSHNRVFLTVPGVVPPQSTTHETLIHPMDMDDVMDDKETLRELFPIENDEDDEDEGYPYDWMDPNFVPRQATSSAKDLQGKQAGRKPRPPTFN